MFTARNTFSVIFAASAAAALETRTIFAIAVAMFVAGGKADEGRAWYWGGGTAVCVFFAAVAYHEHVRRHIERMSMLRQINEQSLARLRRELGPGLCTSLGPVGVARLVVASRLANAVARPGGALAAQVPVRQGRVAVVTDRFVDTAHALGLQVHVWTIDDPDEMGRLLDLGVDGIMTDRPAALREVLESRGVWHGPQPSD